MSTSVLDSAAIARLRMSAADSGLFLDPAVFREAQAILPAINSGWLERIIGYPVGSWTRLTAEETVLAVTAAKADAAHLKALREEKQAAYRAAERERAADADRAAKAAKDAWQALRDSLPVPVEVRHNWTARHLDGYEQGADHIVVLADLSIGRVRRKAGTPLCETPSRARELRHVESAPGDWARLPGCKACLRAAQKIAGDGKREEQGQ